MQSSHLQFSEWNILFLPFLIAALCWNAFAPVLKPLAQLPPPLTSGIQQKGGHCLVARVGMLITLPNLPLGTITSGCPISELVLAGKCWWLYLLHLLVKAFYENHQVLVNSRGSWSQNFKKATRVSGSILVRASQPRSEGWYVLCLRAWLLGCPLRGCTQVSKFDFASRVTSQLPCNSTQLVNRSVCLLWLNVSKISSLLNHESESFRETSWVMSLPLSLNAPPTPATVSWNQPTSHHICFRCPSECRRSWGLSVCRSSKEKKSKQ